MKIRTIANEMAIQAPSDADYALIKYCFPNPNEFPWPTPEEVSDRYMTWVTSSDYTNYKAKGEYISRRANRFLTSFNKTDYFGLYRDGMIHLQNVYDMRSDIDGLRNYFAQHPVWYRKGVEPVDASGNVIIDNCINNLCDKIYESSVAGYQHLRQPLINKIRKLKEDYIAACKNAHIPTRLRLLPQRPRTSRNLSEDESIIRVINAGYRLTNTYDPEELALVPLLELVTWFYTDANRTLRVFKEYFDASGGIEPALEDLRNSALCKGWVESMNPKDYTFFCEAYEITENQEEEIKNLTPLNQLIEKK